MHRDGDQSSGSVLYGTVALVGPGTGCLSVIRTSGLPCDARPGFRTPVAVLFADKRNPPSSSRLSSIISCPSSVYRPSVISHLSSVSRLPSLIYLSFVWNATSSLEGRTPDTTSTISRLCWQLLYAFLLFSFKRIFGFCFVIRKKTKLSLFLKREQMKTTSCTVPGPRKKPHSGRQGCRLRGQPCCAQCPPGPGAARWWLVRAR